MKIIILNGMLITVVNHIKGVVGFIFMDWVSRNFIFYCISFTLSGKIKNLTHFQV